LKDSQRIQNERKKEKKEKEWKKKAIEVAQIPGILIHPS